jgi:hypothetical protein
MSDVNTVQYIPDDDLHITVSRCCEFCNEIYAVHFDCPACHKEYVDDDAQSFYKNDDQHINGLICAECETEYTLLKPDQSDLEDWVWSYTLSTKNSASNVISCTCDHNEQEK